MHQLFFFRVDANEDIGTGHLMRCLALANELSQRGAECRFILQRPSDEIIQLIKKNGHKAIQLPNPVTQPNKKQRTNHAHWLTLDWKLDAQATINAAEPLEQNYWIIVDHYGIDHKWHSVIKKNNVKLLVIDDLIEKKIKADIFINQNIFTNSEAKKVSQNSSANTLLLGPQYALLRHEFKHQEVKKAIRQKICVMFGGADQSNLTQTCVTALINNKINVETIIIVGSLYKHTNDLKKIVKNHPQYKIYQAVNNINELISDATLVIGSPGVSALERCALGLPSINISIADNQIRPGKALGQLGASLYLGKASNIKIKDLIHGTQLLLKNNFLRNLLSKNARSLCDGNGINRIANLLIHSDLKLRKASENDSKLIFSWRNNSSIRLNSLNTEKISWSTHKEWFSESIKNPKRVMLIAETDAQSIGCVRADLEDGAATISIFLNPTFIGHGYGTPMLESLESWLMLHHPKTKLLQADVLPFNTASQKVFENAGYLKKSIKYTKLT